MNYIERSSVLLSLAEELRAAGSWCGETHFQKTTYILQEMLSVPLDFRFILYKHGPYSFDLADIITEMRADQLVTIESRHPYGVSITQGPNASTIFRLAPEPRQRHLPAIQYVAKRLGPFGVTELEKLATAFWVTQECPDCQPDERARRLSELKPHIAIEDSKKAIAEVQALRSAAETLTA